jgi:hypothetical protein
MVPRDWSRRTYDFSFIDPRFGGLVITARDCEIIFPDGGNRQSQSTGKLSKVCAKELCGHCSAAHAAATIASSYLTYTASCIANAVLPVAVPSTPANCNQPKAAPSYKVIASVASWVNIPIAQQSIAHLGCNIEPRSACSTDCASSKRVVPTCAGESVKLSPLLAPRFAPSPCTKPA